MINVCKVAEDTTWIGASDRRLDLFENLFPLPKGVSYNNYVVTDEKTVLFDTSDVSVADQFLENLEFVLGRNAGDRSQGAGLDYIVVLHMEPDHCSQLQTVLTRHPEATIVTSLQASNMIKQFFPELAGAKFEIVKEGSVLDTGKHHFHFVAAPMVHWPEVLFAYDDATKALFSADAFGTFGALESSIFADGCNFEQEYLDEARRYYANIVGKFGMQVMNVLKKAAGLDIQEILPLHGPVWRQNLSWFLDKYQKWASYTPETDDIVIFYGSMYGHTASAAEDCAFRLQAATGKEVKVFDVSKTDVSYLIGEVWRCAKIVLFCPTYNGGIYPKMDDFLNDCAALNVQNRTFAIAENGTWAPAAGKLIKAKLSAMKKITVVEPTLSFKSALHAADEEKLQAFVDAIVKA